MTLSDCQWRRLAKALRITGAVCCVVLFIAHFAQLAYFSANRPQAPEPGLGFTVALNWTHPTRYGTVRDERLSQWLFELFFPAFGLIAVGEMVKVYKLKDYSGIRTRPKQPLDTSGGSSA